MTVFENQRSIKSGYTYNGYFEYGGYAFPINVTNFQYSWVQTTSGGANSRLFQVTYPKRPEQGNRGMVTVGLVFRDRQEYYEFGQWVRNYHVAAVSAGGQSALKFSCPVINAYYFVAITNLPMSFTWDMDSAPQIKNLSLMILQDMYDTSGSSTNFNGNIEGMLGDTVGSWQVRSVGERAFAKAYGIQKEKDSIFDEASGAAGAL